MRLGRRTSFAGFLSISGGWPPASMTHEGYCYEGSAWEHVGRARGSPGLAWRSLHHAQAPTVLNHSRTLPQGDGCAGPALAGGAVGGCVLIGSRSVFLTTFPQEDRVAVVIKTQDRHALGEAQIRKVCDPGLESAIRISAVAHNLSPIGRHSSCFKELPAGDVDAGSLEESLHALHSGGRRPAEGRVTTDHDLAVGAHAKGNATSAPRREAETGHGAVDPAECLIFDGVKGLPDHDPAVGVHSGGGTIGVPRQGAETSHGAIDPAEGLAP